jgi:uncharacterized Zn finger protein
METIVELTEPEALKKLATPANFRLGKEIVRQGGVHFGNITSLRVSAKVGGVQAADQRRAVELTAFEDGLHWSCTCSSRRDLFCKHCAAVGLALGEARR